MRLDTVIRNVLLLATIGFAAHGSVLAQKKPESVEMPEMLLTEQGLLAFNAPKGWIRSNGPGLAYFIRKSDEGRDAPIWIYISSAPIGPNEEAKDASSYIQSDIAGFKERFKSGTVSEEKPLSLPKMNMRAPLYTFRSGERHNTIEQVAYITEENRVLTLVLSAKEKAAFERTLPVFHEFVQSYGGSIVPNSPSPDSQ